MSIHISTAKTRAALIIGIVALCLFSCKKTPDTIGNDLIDDNNYINVFHTDTVEVLCHSYFDSIRAKNVRYALLGSINDPVFGTTEAGFYTQFRFSSAGQSFGANPVLDSIVLQLSLDSYYGDTMTLQTVHVYELMDSISSSEPYYNYSTLPVGTIDLANGFQFRPRPKTTSHIYGTDTVTQPIIRIPLSHELGNFLMQIDSSAYNNPDVFKSHFKGLCLVCEAVGQNGAVSSINLTNNNLTRLQLYYHDAATPQNALRYYYYVTSSDNYFNHFDHDYTQGDPDFTQQLLQGNVGLGQERVYLQWAASGHAFISPTSPIGPTRSTRATSSSTRPSSSCLPLPTSTPCSSPHRPSSCLSDSTKTVQLSYFQTITKEKVTSEAAMTHSRSPSPSASRNTSDSSSSTKKPTTGLVSASTGLPTIPTAGLSTAPKPSKEIGCALM